MPGFVAQINGLDFKVMCALHRSPVVGPVLELGEDHGKCLDTRDHSCSYMWYVEGTYKDFELPEHWHVSDPPPTG